MAYKETFTREIEITCSSGVDDRLTVGDLLPDHDARFEITRGRNRESSNVFVNREDAAKLVTALQEWLGQKPVEPAAETGATTIDFSRVRCVEIINSEGHSFMRGNLYPLHVEPSVQDNGHTLKLFTKVRE